MRHLLMDPAFPDLVATVAAEELVEKRPGYASSYRRADIGVPTPAMIDKALRLLAHLW
jgi:hypothetical protein